MVQWWPPVFLLAGLHSYGHLLVITGYFSGIIHFINGVISTYNWYRAITVQVGSNFRNTEGTVPFKWEVCSWENPRTIEDFPAMFDDTGG